MPNSIQSCIDLNISTTILSNIPFSIPNTFSHLTEPEKNYYVFQFIIISSLISYYIYITNHFDL